MKTNIIKTGIASAGKMLAFFLLFAATGCMNYMDDSNGPIITPPSNEVFIQGMAFSPATITIPAGTTVTWTNKDGIIHNVTSNTGIFSSGSIADNGTFSFKFVGAGTYHYHCTIHQSMTGVVIVN